MNVRYMIILCTFVALSLFLSCTYYREKQEIELSVAAAKGDYGKVVRILEDKSVDINAQIKGVDPPLAIAAYAGHKDIVELLIDRGADVNIRDTKGGTPLIEASLGHQPEIVKYLLSKGADPTLSLNSDEAKTLGITALKIAEMNNDDEIISIIKSSN